MKLLLIIISILSLSCMKQGQRSKSASSFALFDEQGVTVGDCNEFFITSTEQCVSFCPGGTHLATPSERADFLVEVANSSIFSELKKIELRDNVNSSENICLDGAAKVRPDQAMDVDQNLCACKDKQPIVVGNCTSTCANTSNANFILEGTVTPGTDMLLSANFPNLNKWCTTEVEGVSNAPSCLLVATTIDGDSAENPITTFAGTNRFEVNINDQTFAPDKTFVAKIIVRDAEGNESASKDFQFKKLKEFDPDLERPIAVRPISQYTCIERKSATHPDGSQFFAYFNFFFYYNSSNEPRPLADNGQSLVCHDINDSQTDATDIPRLQNRPAHFALWTTNDARMVAASSGSTVPLINAKITAELTNRGIIGDTNQYFNVLPYKISPVEEDNTNLGFFLISFLNENGNAYCPGVDEYNSNTAIFNILKELTGRQETEGLYMGISAIQRTFIDLSGTLQEVPDNLILLKQSILEKIWFYYDNNIRIGPRDTIEAKNKTIRFFWPPNIDDPLVEDKATQREYIIRHPSETSNSTGLSTSVITTDKRLGCVPKS